MKRILIAVVILLVAGTIVCAQQAGTTTKEDKQKYLDQAKKNSSEFESTLEELIANNSRSGDEYKYNQLKSEIDQLDSKIRSESASIKARHDSGNRVSTGIMDGLEKNVNQHKDKVAELGALVNKK